MALPPLATAADLTARAPSLAGASPEQVNAALIDASAAVRRYSGQVFTRVESTDILRTACCGQLRLPQRPVNDVAGVVNIDGVAVAWDWIEGTDRLAVSSMAREFAVTYDHGYDDGEVPADVVAITCNVAARSLGQGREDAGVTQRSITNYSESFNPTAGTGGGTLGPIGLFDDERKALDVYRRVGNSARVCIR